MRILRVFGLAAVCCSTVRAEPPGGWEEIAADEEQGFGSLICCTDPPADSRIRCMRCVCSPNRTTPAVLVTISSTTPGRVPVGDPHAAARPGSARRLAGGRADLPGPKDRWQIYTHALDRDTLLVEDGDLADPDLNPTTPSMRRAGAHPESGARVASEASVQMLFITPRSPCQGGCVENMAGKPRDKFAQTRDIRSPLPQTQVLVER